MYYLILLAGLFFQLFNKKFLFVIFTTILILFAFLRHGIGVDYFAYEYLYNLLLPSFMDEINFGLGDQEVGFRVIGSILKSYGISYEVYLALFAFITMLFMYKICKRYSINPTLSMVLFFSFYYLTWTLSGIRQGLVLAIGIYYLLRYIEDNKGLKLVIVSVLLSLIHMSALSLIVYFLLSKIDFKKGVLIILTIFSVIASLLPLGSLIINMPFLPFYSSILPYIDVSRSINLLDFQSLSRIVFLIIVFIFYDVYVEQGKLYKIIINLYILSMIIYFGLQFSELLAARIAIYGKFLDIIIFANVLYMYRKKINSLIYMYVIFILCSLYLHKEVGAQIKTSVESDSLIAPYPNILNADEHKYLNEYRNSAD